MPTLLPIQPEQAFDLTNFAKYLAYHDINSLPARVSREKKKLKPKRSNLHPVRKNLFETLTLKRFFTYE